MFYRTFILFSAATLCIACMAPRPLYAQAGLRDALEKLDRNEDGEISPDEITPLARPYLERITKPRRMSLNRPNRIDHLQQAARIYHALQNGVAGRDVRPKSDHTVRPFGPDPDKPLVPEFGLAQVKYPYTQADIDEADRTLRRYDRNKDGYVDRAEAARSKWTHRNPFEMDLNKDDRLSRLELGQRYARRRLLSNDSDELVQKARRTGNGIRSSKPDDDDDRNSSQWWRNGGSRYYLTATILRRFDLNQNQKLELSEAQSLGIAPGRIDVDRDGELSRDELQDYFDSLRGEAGDFAEGLPGWFYELDANRDKQVAMAEFSTEWTEDKLREFAILDKNGDGLLTSDEAIQSKALAGGGFRNDRAEILPPRKTIISEIEVSEDFAIGDLNVQLSITHSHTSYLDAYLTGPDGQRIELFSEVGGSGDHFDQAVFDDQARYPITKAKAPFRGNFLPEALLKRQPSLSHYQGKSVKGVWQLVIRGTRNSRYGMLHSWALLVKPQEGVDGPAILELPNTSGGEKPEFQWPAAGTANPRSSTSSAGVRPISQTSSGGRALEGSIPVPRTSPSAPLANSFEKNNGFEKNKGDKQAYAKANYSKEKYAKEKYATDAEGNSARDKAQSKKEKLAKRELKQTDESRIERKLEKKRLLESKKQLKKANSDRSDSKSAKQ